MANKARYYGLSTKEERQDMADNSRGARVYPSEFGYRAVKAALLNYKDTHSDFNSITSSVAAGKIATLLTETGLYGKVTKSSSRVIGEGYSISLTKTKNGITPSRASERIEEEKKK